MNKIIDKLRKKKTGEENLIRVTTLENGDTLCFKDKKGRYVYIAKEEVLRMIKETSFWRENILEGIDKLYCPFCKSRVDADVQFADFGIVSYYVVCPACQYSLTKNVHYRYEVDVKENGNRNVYCQLYDVGKANLTLAQMWNNSKYRK